MSAWQDLIGSSFEGGKADSFSHEAAQRRHAAPPHAAYGSFQGRVPVDGLPASGAAKCAQRRTPRDDRRPLCVLSIRQTAECSKKANIRHPAAYEMHCAFFMASSVRFYAEEANRRHRKSAFISAVRLSAASTASSIMPSMSRAFITSRALAVVPPLLVTFSLSVENGSPLSRASTAAP